MIGSSSSKATSGAPSSASAPLASMASRRRSRAHRAPATSRWRTVMPKVLFVLSSHGTLGDTGKPTGWYLPEAAHPHAVLAREGIEVEFASPQGGAPPMTGVDATDPVQRSFLESTETAEAVRDT